MKTRSHELRAISGVYIRGNRPSDPWERGWVFRVEPRAIGGHRPLKLWVAVLHEDGTVEPRRVRRSTLAAGNWTALIRTSACPN